MTIQVGDNWWKDLFDEIYLMTDARSVCDESLTIKEVDFIEETLDLENALGMDKTASILDLCGGQGRHALELSRRGYVNVTVLDYSEYLIGLGRQRAKDEGLPITFLQGDARNTGLSPETFEFIMIMANSFGYCLNEDENSKILCEACRLLKSRGRFFLDLPDRDHLIQHFSPFSLHHVNEDITVRRERELGEDIIFSREKVISKSRGCIRDRTYCTHLYNQEKISCLMHSAGFSSIICTRDFMNREGRGADYGFMTNRMIVMALK